MRVSLKQLLPTALRSGYAVAAFNVTNLETAQAAVSAAVEQRSPVILAISESAAKYGGRALFAAVCALADDVPIPAVVHLDHHIDLPLIKQGLDWGATSVMFDGSHLPLLENITQTKGIVRLAHRRRVSVEGEIGMIGGQEDGSGAGIQLAVIKDAVQFTGQTRVDAIALGLGTSHGLPVAHETIHISILEQYYLHARTPVVLHGASNLPPSMIRAGIRHGVAKINIDTQLRQAFTAAVKRTLTKDEKLINVRDYIGQGRDSMRQEAMKILKMFGSVNEAHALRHNR